MTDQLIPYRQGMEYGVGMDTPSADARNTAVAGEPTSIPNAGGIIVDFGLTQISSDEDLQTSLGISASATGGFGAFSASASMDYARKCHVHENSVFMLASVTVLLGFAQIKSPKIVPEAAAKLTDGNSTRFQEMYGDSFVRGMQTGGRFFAVIEIATSDRAEHESLSIKAKGSYGPFSGSGAFSTDFQQAMSSRSLKITVHSEGGLIPTQPTSLDAVQAVASGFAATVEDHAVPYAVLLDKYTILDLPTPPNYADLEHQLDVLKFCATERNRAWTAINNVEYILDHPDQFTMPPDQEEHSLLAAYIQALKNDLDTIAKAASHALDHPKDASMPTLTAVVPSLPQRVLHSSKQVEIYSHANYAMEWKGIPGAKQVLSPGRYDTAQLLVGSDQVSSMKIPEGLAVRAYEHSWFQGAFIDYTNDVSAVSTEWNDRISSLIAYNAVDGPPKIEYAMALDFAWSPRRLELSPGKYPDLGATVLGAGKLSTLLIPQGLVVRLWEGPNFEGTSVEFSSDCISLPPEWDNRAASIEVIDFRP